MTTKTPTDVEDLIRSCFGQRGLFDVPRADRAAREAKIQAADFEEVEGVFDLLEAPGKLAEDFPPGDLQLAFASTLTSWGKRDPERMLNEIAARIGVSSTRPVLLMVVQELGVPRAVEVLRPLWEHVEQLTEDEQVDLVSALWLSRSPEAQHIIERLAQQISPSRRRAHEEIVDALAWLARHDSSGHSGV